MLQNATPSTSSVWVTLTARGQHLAVLAPGNGFPPQVYRPLAEGLPPSWRVLGWIPPAMRDPNPPPEDLQWVHLAREYVAHLEGLGSDPLIGLGHSLGGVITLMAAVMRPERFRAVVLLDPVIFEPRVLCQVRRWQRRGAPLDPAFPLARLILAARQRRTHFPSPQEALEHFRTRPLFRGWHPEALEAYVRAGLRPESYGWRLAYDPRWEAAIFASVPTDVWRWVRRVRVPGLVLFGERSEIGTPATRRHLQRLWPQATVQVIPEQGHLFPMETPEAASASIRTWWHRFSPQGRSP